MTYEPRGQWLSAADIREANILYGYEAKAIERWQQSGLVGGKGLTQAQ